MMDYSFSMQSCRSHFSLSEAPFYCGGQANANDLSKWQQSIAVLLWGHINLVGDPGDEWP